jgi:hypothetical protein
VYSTNILTGGRCTFKDVRVEEEVIADAVTYTDPLLRGEASTHLLFMADVSFNFVDKKCGYGKTSLMTAVDFSHRLNVCAVTMISHEDQATFEFELETYIRNEDPTLPSRATVWIVDGDRGRIAAIRKLLPLAKIYLCLWHKAENLKTHFGAALRAGTITVAKLKEKIKEPETGSKCVFSWQQE